MVNSRLESLESHGLRQERQHKKRLEHFASRAQQIHGFWVNYNDLTTTSLEIMVSKENHPQMALIQISELL